MKRGDLIKFFSCIMLAMMSACVKYHPQPISPSQTASSFESRTLDNPSLKEFIEANLHHEVTPWPPKSWDFTMLTLVAFYYHPDLDVARARWGVTQAGIITAGRRPNPSVGFIPQYDVDALSGISPWIFNFTLDIPIETAGKRGYRITQATQLSEAVHLSIAIVAWQVRSRLRTGLLNLYAAEQTMVILEKMLTVQEEIVKLLEKRLDIGEVSQPDVTQAHISLNQARLSLHQAQKQRAEACVQLATALGLPVNALEGTEISSAFSEHLPTEVSSPDLRRQALISRPDILSSLAEYAASQTALQLEVAKQYPDLQLGPGYQYDQGEDKWSLGFSVTLPVLNRNEGPIAEAEARRIEAQARFTALQARVISEIDQAQAGYPAALQNLETANILLVSQEKHLQSVQEMFNIGETDRLALLHAQLELETTALSRLDTFVKAQQSLGSLEDALQRPLGSVDSFPMIPEANPRVKEEDTR